MKPIDNCWLDTQKSILNKTKVLVPTWCIRVIWDYLFTFNGSPDDEQIAHYYQDYFPKGCEQLGKPEGFVSQQPEYFCTCCGVETHADTREAYLCDECSK